MKFFDFLKNFINHNLKNVLPLIFYKKVFLCYVLLCSDAGNFFVKPNPWSVKFLYTSPIGAFLYKISSDHEQIHVSYSYGNI
jgi:hypothetical protein